jgi:hypothetical protein
LLLREKFEGRTFNIKEIKLMAVKKVSGLVVYLNPEYPPELDQRRYATSRDEMLWRQYNSVRTLKNPGATRNALNILRVIRQTPD